MNKYVLDILYFVNTDEHAGYYYISYYGVLLIDFTYVGGAKLFDYETSILKTLLEDEEDDWY